MKHNSILGTLLVALSLAALLLSLARPSTLATRGTLARLSDTQWGIRVDPQPLHPFMRRTFLVSSVPGALQKNGQRVQGTFHVVDVIGSGVWDTVVEAEGLSTTSD